MVVSAATPRVSTMKLRQTGLICLERFLCIPAWVWGCVDSFQFHLF